jgi:hypothetical protein
MQNLTREVNHLPGLEKASLSQAIIPQLQYCPGAHPEFINLRGGGLLTLRLHKFMFDFGNYVIKTI